MGYWDNICKMQQKQTEKGIKTYGQTLEQNTSLTDLERLEYLQEELIDGLMYIEHIKANMVPKEDKSEDATYCPECAGDSKVIDTRWNPLGEKYRRRQCLDCGHKWNTVERMMNGMIYVIGLNYCHTVN